MCLLLAAQPLLDQMILSDSPCVTLTALSNVLGLPPHPDPEARYPRQHLGDQDLPWQLHSYALCLPAGH